MAALSLVMAFLSLVAVFVASAGLVDLLPPPLEAIKNIGRGADCRSFNFPPWMVTVNVCHEPTCVGARISRRWVLGEAQCTVAHSDGVISIFTKLDGEPRELNVGQVVIHDQYLLDRHYAISAFKTTENMTEGEFIKLPNAPPEVNRKLNVYRWETREKKPKMTEMVVKDLSTCSNVSYSELKRDLQLCAANVTDIYSFSSWAGGLMVLNDSVLVGLVPSGCYGSDYALHTSVAGFREWIRNTTSV